MSLWEARLRRIVEYNINGWECYYDLYDGEVTEDPRCLADGLDGFGTPY